MPVPGTSSYYNGSGSSLNNAPASGSSNAFDGNPYPDFVAANSPTGKYWGSMSKADYDATLMEQQSAREAREFEAYMSNTAFRRKVADVLAAGFSPLAALEGSQGAAVPTAQVARASRGGSSGGFGNVLPALIMAIATIASKGVSSAGSAANASALEATRQANRLAVEKMRATAAMERIAQRAENAKTVAEFKEAGNMARAEMRAASAREALDLRGQQLAAQKEIAAERLASSEAREAVRMTGWNVDPMEAGIYDDWHAVRIHAGKNYLQRLKKQKYLKH